LKETSEEEMKEKNNTNTKPNTPKIASLLTNSGKIGQDYL